MADRFIAARHDKTFATEVEARKEMETIVTGRDAQRPVEKRFEVQALHRATPITLADGAQLFSVGDLAFILSPNQKTGFDLFSSGKGMSFSTITEAKEWVSEFAQIAPGAWKIFGRGATD